LPWSEGNHSSTGVQCGTTDKVDIVLLVAETHSMKDFETIRCFVSDVVRVFDIGPERFQLGATLYYINHELFKPHVGIRRESQKVAVLITDAGSWNNVDFPLQILKGDGIEIHIIGD
ncbi:hypothetical protein INR49_021961, partial [Caranx melampygus]